ncbi:hypothetical protein BLNAU_10493 [Blattamonas nauphoetae]|uniref:Uncharacterized protein n=1 Tax=Blattamonas nauphoetae TaxID=2049346 RepID=A0ABQ9XSZ0_9EUKA|nr:hypothetical protein BLNAU_10493 [Blattamonas nauphoetae]
MRLGCRSFAIPLSWSPQSMYWDQQLEITMLLRLRAMWTEIGRHPLLAHEKGTNEGRVCVNHANSCERERGDVEADDELSSNASIDELEKSADGTED